MTNTKLPAPAWPARAFVSGGRPGGVPGSLIP